MIVVDASAAVSALVHDGAARALLSEDDIHVPHLIDSEIVDTFRKLLLRGVVSEQIAAAAITTWGELGLARYPAAGLSGRIWELRSNLSAYDGAYVALAETLGCRLVTADRRLATAPGPRCPIEVVPR